MGIFDHCLVTEVAINLKSVSHASGKSGPNGGFYTRFWKGRQTIFPNASGSYRAPAQTRHCRHNRGPAHPHLAGIGAVLLRCNAAEFSVSHHNCCGPSPRYGRMRENPRTRPGGREERSSLCLCRRRLRPFFHRVAIRHARLRFRRCQWPSPGPLLLR